MNNKLYKFLGYWWKSGDLEEPDDSDIEGPFCPDCYCEIEPPSEKYDEYYDFSALEQNYQGEIICSNCDKRYQLKKTLFSLKTRVASKLRSNHRALFEKISLDEPLTQVKVRDQDDKYFLAAKIGQKDGRRVGVVYFGEKNKDQDKMDYSQIFIDLDDEQLRFDKSNKPPKDILAKMKVEFPRTVNEIKFEKDKGGES